MFDDEDISSHEYDCEFSQVYPDNLTYYEDRYEYDRLLPYAEKYKPLSKAFIENDFQLVEYLVKNGLPLENWPDLRSYLIKLFTSSMEVFRVYSNEKDIKKYNPQAAFDSVEKIISWLLDLNLNPDTPLKGHQLWFYFVILGDNEVFFSSDIIDKCFKHKEKDYCGFLNTEFRIKFLSYQYRDNQKKVLIKKTTSESEKKVFNDLQSLLLDQNFSEAEKLLSNNSDIANWDNVNEFFCQLFRKIKKALKQNFKYISNYPELKNYNSLNPFSPTRIFSETEDIISFLLKHNWVPNFLCEGNPFILYLVKLRDEDYFFSNEIILNCIRNGADIFTLNKKCIPVFAYISKIESLCDFLTQNGIEIPKWEL